MQVLKTNNISKPYFGTSKSVYKTNDSIKTDCFQKNIQNIDNVQNKFNQLFPNGKINEIYSNIIRDLGIDVPPKLNFIYDEKSERGGGYTFRTNSIDMNLYDLINSNKKVVGIDNYGNKHQIVSQKEKLPAYLNSEGAQEYINIHNKEGSLGYTKLIVEDVTPDEQKKFIIQKIVHECVHAKQQQIIRETEGFDDKSILKAWIYKKTKNLIDVAILDYNTDKSYNESAWVNQKTPIKKYSKNSEMYKKALIYLDAIQNYPPITSQMYPDNAIEKEAFDISFDYVNSNNF